MRILLLAALSMMFLGCSGQAVNTVDSTSENTAKIRVYSDGEITLNDRDISVDDLPPALEELAENDGTVWYYREFGQEDPHPNAIGVIQAIAETEAANYDVFTTRFFGCRITRWLYPAKVRNLLPV